jgi:phenylacetate-coenzyme A ligase PaaK-like adenylate-forming protein
MSDLLKVKTSGTTGLAVPMFTVPKFPVTVWAERMLQEAHSSTTRTAHRPTSMLRLAVRLFGWWDATIETGSQNDRFANIMTCFSLE